jgi:hypothetical protein
MTSRLLVSCALPLLALSLSAQEPSSTFVPVRVPQPDIGVLTLDVRREAQLKTVDQLEVPWEFSFTNKLEASGIAFVHQVTEDTLREFKPVHYDHSNGLLVADVDGDGRYDLYFLTQLGGNELWRNLGGGRFENITEKAGVAVADRVSASGSFADVDNDGDPDLYVTTVRMGNLFFRNDGEGRFTEVSKAMGLDYLGHSSATVFFDYDLDGWLDCFLTNIGNYTIDEQGPGPYWVGRVDAFFGHQYPERTETSILYRSLEGKRMEDVSSRVGLVDGGWTGDAAFVDLTGDAYPDLYVLNMQGEDHYYENAGGERFVDRSHELFPRTPWGAMGIEFFDYDNDGLMDLYLTDMHSDMTEHGPVERETLKGRVLQDPDTTRFIAGNAFFKNHGDGKFVEISDEIGVENYWPWGVSVADINADGFEDIFVASSMSYPFRYGINSMFLNNRGKKFLPVEFILGIEPRQDGETHVKSFRLECDGADKDHQECEPAGRSGKIEIWGTLGTRSSAIFDLDDDGDLDIVTSEFGARPQVLISDLAQQHEIRYLKIELEGRESNRDGLGAVVKLVAGDQEYTQTADGKSGYLSQSSLPLYFGLGKAQKVDRIEVRWPSGRTQTLTEGLPIDDLLWIREATD